MEGYCYWCWPSTLKDTLPLDPSQREPVYLTHYLSILISPHIAATLGIMATNQASRILPKLFVAATATGGTIFACHHLESQRRILDDKSRDGCTSSTISGALTSLESKLNFFVAPHRVFIL